MKGWHFLAAVGAGLMGLLPAAAEAAVRPSAFTLTPLAGIYWFESGEELRSAPTFTLGLGYHFSKRWSGEVLTGYIDSRSRIGGNENVDGYPLRVDVLYHLRPGGRFVPHFAAGFGGLLLDDPGGETDVDAVFGYGFGLRYFLTESAAFRADLRHLYVTENLRFEERGLNHLSAMAGISLQIGGDREPPPQIDSDGDGVIDAFDRCPDTPLGVPVDGFGCPKDSDGDGVPDYLDRCPGTPAGVKVDRHGCPVDSDGDGVPDYLDRCPGTPAGISVDEHGCPRDPLPPQSRSLDYPPSELNLRLEFASGRVDIRPEFAEELERAIDFILAHPGRRILVEGHTDSVGPAEYNLDLSQRRAEFVRQFLLDETSIEPERIVARGYGESRPIADNSTQEGRLLNRRVVITILGNGNGE